MIANGGNAQAVLRSARDLWLALRMTCWALALSVLKHAVALPKLASLMSRDGSGVASNAEIDRVVRLSAIAARFRPLPHRDNCLERSLIRYRYLSRLNAKPHLVMAVRRDQERMHGHAWVTVQGRPVGGEDVSAFTPVLELGSNGTQVSIE